VPIQPLSPGDSIHVVRSVLRAERIIELATAEIIARADGNPLFLEELTLHAGEAKDLRLGLMVPDTIHDVVMARIDRLPDELKQLLQVASVIGREFSLRLLTAVWRGAEPLETLLRKLNRLEFVHERVVGDGIVYVFRHALTQETAYGSLLERHRKAHHGTVGRALEQLYRDRRDEVAELLAFHFGRSDDVERAVDYAILAAEKAQHHWANSDALRYFNDALHRLDRLPDKEANRLRRIDAVLKQSEVEYALGHYTEHLQALERIRSIVDQNGDPRRRAGWHYWTGFLHSVSGGRPEVAIDYCREAAKIASAAGFDDINAFAESCLAQIYVVAGKLHDAVETGERALFSFEAQGNLWWAARTLWFLSIAANGLGAWEMSARYCRRGVDYGIALEELRFKSVQAVGWWRMGSAYIQQGDLERGLQCCREALALTPIPRDAVMAKAACAYAEIKAGRFDAGIAGLTETLAWFDRSDLRYSHQFYALWLAEGYLRRGDRATARPLIEDLVNTCRDKGYLQLEGRACWLMGECLAAEASAAAEDYVETAMRIFEDVGARNDLARAMVTRAALRQATGDNATARQLLEYASMIFRELGTRGESARIGAALAALDRGLPIRLLDNLDIQIPALRGGSA
jgi:tetratricopeptide (TPR) repeat protein